MPPAPPRAGLFFSSAQLRTATSPMPGRSTPLVTNFPGNFAFRYRHTFRVSLKFIPTRHPVPRHRPGGSLLRRPGSPLPASCRQRGLSGFSAGDLQPRVTWQSSVPPVLKGQDTSGVASLISEPFACPVWSRAASRRRGASQGRADTNTAPQAASPEPTQSTSSRAGRKARTPEIFPAPFVLWRTRDRACTASHSPQGARNKATARVVSGAPGYAGRQDLCGRLGRLAARG